MTYNPISGPIGRLFPHPARSQISERRGLCPARFLVSRDNRWTKDYDEQHLFTPSGVGHFDRGLYPTHWESGTRGSAIAARSTTDLDRHGEDWGNKNGSAQFDRA